MIPLRLELKNFMSYGEDVSALDFSGMHMLCLSGENGNGKSALLDAMTWALWGESRLGRQGHEELIRKGADEMSVIFTFEMDGQVYRVLRKRSKRSGGQQWELHQQTPDQGLGTGWRPLTGTSSGDTAAAIQKLLRMSYDTFVNSAYLRQGQADQFVRQSASKRKEILADILDLSRYDRLEAKARDKAREAGAEATDLERELNSIDGQLRAEPEHRARLQELTRRRDELAALGAQLLADIYALRDRKKELEGQQKVTDALRAEISRLDAEIVELEAEVAAQERESQAGRALLARKDEICRDHAQLLDARRRLEQLDAGLGQWLRGKELLAQAENEWIKAENEVRSRARQAAYEHEEAQKRVLEMPDIAERRAKVAARVEAWERTQAARPALVERMQAAQDEFTRLEQDSKYLTQRIEEWDGRLDALARQEARCSVCDSPLPPERIAATADEYRARREETVDERRRVRQDGKSAKEKVQALTAQLKALDAELRAGQADQQHLGQLNQQLLSFEATQNTIPTLVSVREAAERTLAAGDFAPEVSAKLERYRRGLKPLENVEVEHAETKVLLSRLGDAERLHFQLDQAEAAVRTADGYLLRARRSLQARQEARASARTQLAELPDVSTELARLTSEEDGIKQREMGRRHEDQQVNQQIGAHERALADMEGLKVIRLERAKQLGDAKREHEVHDQLVKAFGKKGVQALIIENAIPELQEEANRLLERLTDGDMRLFFETLKDSKAKKDSPIETLEIKVEDSSGPRPLEMYSGGESFRAAFALRIALSKLLARRAGARLQTLIIDEGFGTQDGKGREKLVDALTAISDDFERIIVISHIDELKDAFPTRVEITKTPSGSQITVMEGAAG